MMQDLIFPFHYVIWSGSAEAMAGETAGVLAWIFISWRSQQKTKAFHLMSKMKQWKVLILLNCDFEYTYRNVLCEEMGSCVY